MHSPVPDNTIRPSPSLLVGLFDLKWYQLLSSTVVRTSLNITWLITGERPPQRTWRPIRYNSAAYPSFHYLIIMNLSPGIIGKVVHWLKVDFLMNICQNGGSPIEAGLFWILACLHYTIKSFVRPILSSYLLFFADWFVLDPVTASCIPHFYIVPVTKTSPGNMTLSSAVDQASRSMAGILCTISFRHDSPIHSLFHGSP